MKRTLASLSLVAGILFSAIAVTGCGGQSYNRNHYVLQASPPAKTGARPADTVLAVRRFTIDSAYQSSGLVYRKGEFQYETDFYNHFLVSPADMITEKTRNWLAESGDFATVLDPASTVNPTHTLKANIIALYGDFRPDATPKAVMGIRFFLTAEKAAPQTVLLAKTYTSSHDLKEKNAGALVEGFDACLTNILNQLEADLRGAL